LGTSQFVIVTNPRWKSSNVVKFYNKRSTAEQWIKEGKYTLNWTRLSCHDFTVNQIRLQLFALAYNLGNFLRRLKRQVDSGRKISAAFLVKNVGLFAAGTEKIAPTVRDNVLYSIFIRTNAHRMGGVLALNKRQQDFINNWEAEAFRKKLASGKK